MGRSMWYGGERLSKESEARRRWATRIGDMYPLLQYSSIFAVVSTQISRTSRALEGVGCVVVVEEGCVLMRKVNERFPTVQK